MPQFSQLNDTLDTAVSKIKEFARQAIHYFQNLSFLQQALTVALIVTGGVLGLLFLIFSKSIFNFFFIFALKWQQLGIWGVILMFTLIFICSFPPVIGYTTLGNLCGMIYGFPGGWPILAFSTVCGCTASFMFIRMYFSNYGNRLASKYDSLFHGLNTAFDKNDRHSLGLLIMLRFCPLPYSLSNGAMASIESIPLNYFVIATAVGTSRLFIHIFIGARFMELGDNKKDGLSKFLDVLSILLAGGFMTATAWIIYKKYQKSLSEIEGQRYEEVEGGENFSDHELFNSESDDEFEV